MSTCVNCDGSEYKCYYSVCMLYHVICTITMLQMDTHLLLVPSIDILVILSTIFDIHCG